MVMMRAYVQYIQSYAVKNTLLCIIIPIYLDRHIIQNQLQIPDPEVCGSGCIRRDHEMGNHIHTRIVVQKVPLLLQIHSPDLAYNSFSLHEWRYFLKGTLGNLPVGRSWKIENPVIPIVVTLFKRQICSCQSVKRSLNLSLNLSRKKSRVIIQGFFRHRDHYRRRRQ